MAKIYFGKSVNSIPFDEHGNVNTNLENFVIPKTESYSLTEADFSTSLSNIEMNVATANTVTIDDAALAAVPVGAKANVYWYGVGQPQFVPGGSAVLLSGGGADKIAERYTAISVIKRSATEFYLIGNLTT